MVDAVADLLDGGRVKLYCVDSYDGASWSDRSLSLEERARRHGAYESWIIDQVTPWIHDDCGGPIGVAHHRRAAWARSTPPTSPCAGRTCSRGPCACRATTTRARWHGWGERGDALYFKNPMAYVSDLHGDHLDWLRAQVRLILVCGQGMWEDTTGALDSTRTFAGLLAEAGVPHELDLWGHDVAHDWPWWRRQFAHHLPRICDEGGEAWTGT